MKKLIYIALIAAGVFSLNSCEKDTQDTSKVTYYVNMEFNGDEIMPWEKGTPFQDPWVIATENGEDVSNNVTVSGSVDADTKGIYFLNYTAVNQDGFPKTITRTVAVYDPTATSLPDMSGTYNVADGSFRLQLSNGAKVAFSGYKVTLAQVAPGIYSVSDYFGGYYEVRAGYGSTYAMRGYCSLEDDDTITDLYSLVNGWGDSIDYLDDGIYDPAAQTISWKIGYAGAYEWNLTLTK